MHRMQSGGWPYSKVGRDSLKAPSLRVAVLRAAVFSSKILRSDRMTFHYLTVLCVSTTEHVSLPEYAYYRTCT